MSEPSSEMGDITLLGTVHASENSRDTVQAAIHESKPDTVAVELNPDRHRDMRNTDSRGPPTVSELISAIRNDQLTITGAIVNYLFSHHQSRLFSGLALQPGEADMLPAIDAAKDIDATPALIDSGIAGVMNSIGKSISPRTLLRHLYHSDVRDLLSSYHTLKSVVTRTELEDARSIEDAVTVMESIPYDELETLLDAYETLLPDGTFEMLIHERNLIMAGYLQWLRERGDSVIAVMGRMHVPGVREYLESPETIPREFVVEPPYA